MNPSEVLQQFLCDPEKKTLIFKGKWGVTKHGAILAARSLQSQRPILTTVLTLALAHSRLCRGIASLILSPANLTQTTCSVSFEPRLLPSVSGWWRRVTVQGGH